MDRVSDKDALSRRKFMASVAAASAVALGPVACVGRGKTELAPSPPFPSHAVGIDLSHHQHSVDLAAVARQSVDFVYLKASEGVTITDPKFAARWTEARRVGLRRGAYHFFHPDDPAADQVARFRTSVGPLERSDLPPAIDVEVSDREPDDVIIERMLGVVAGVEKVFGRRPIVYSDHKFAAKNLNKSRFSRYALWLAAYQAGPPAVPGPWANTGWAFWQYTENGTVDGVGGPVDLSVFKGPPQELDAFIDASRTQ